MILYFDKYGTLVKRENEGETWVQGDDQSYSLKAKFYDDTQANITEDTPFIDLSNYVVNCVVEREDKSKTPTLTMNRFDANTGAKVLVDNWWTELNGNITVTIRLVDIVENSVKATGLATITINRGNVPSDTTITNSEKAALEKNIALKEDVANKVKNVNDVQLASDILYPTEKAVAKVKENLNTLINTIKNDLLNKLQVLETNISSNTEEIILNKTDILLLLDKTQILQENIDSLNIKDTDLQNQINNLVKEIGTLVIGDNFVKKSQKIADIDLQDDITKEELVYSIISLFGSAAQVNTGITPNTIPVIQNDGKLPKSIIPINDGLIYGGVIESVGENEALIYPSDEMIAKYPSLSNYAEDSFTITKETTEYSDTYFVLQSAPSTGETVLGLDDCENGDWIIANGKRGFFKIDNVDAVKSVNGMKGVVVIKPKDLILEDYATSELDDNNIYPTDSTQTGLAKLDKRVKTLQESAVKKAPDIVFEIRSFETLTEIEKALIVEKVKSITNNFNTGLVYESFNDIKIQHFSDETGPSIIKTFSLVGHEHIEANKNYYKFTFNLNENTEFILTVVDTEEVSIETIEFAKKEEVDAIQNVLDEVETLVDILNGDTEVLLDDILGEDI